MKLTILLLLLAGPSKASYKSIARDLAGPARRAELARVVVLPFKSVDGSPESDGWAISEKLVTQLTRTGRVQAVERSMLHKVMEEHWLGRTGALDSRGLKKLGKVLAADAIITGSFITLGRELIVNARLIDVQTGLIVAACERRVERDWFNVPAPASMADVLDLRDAVGQDEAQECEGAAGRVDELETEILELKARYWAGRLRRGVDPKSLTRNPGSSITDPELKRRFYRRLKELFHSEDELSLTPAEMRRFVFIDRRSFTIAKECGL